MTYQQFKDEFELIATLYDLQNLDNLSFTSLQDLCHDSTKLVSQMLNHIKTTTEQVNVDKDKILRATRGVFKYRTKSNSKGYSTYTSSKYDLVQVGYLDLEDNIVFNEVQRPVSESDQYSIIRYLPGFHIRQYHSCEEYVPKIDSNKEIKEVISSEIVEYSSGSYSSNKEVYSVIGFLNDKNQLVCYDQIIE